MCLPIRLLQRLLWILPVSFFPLMAQGQQLAIDSVTVLPDGAVEIYWNLEGNMASGATFKVDRNSPQDPQLFFPVVENLSPEASSFVDHFDDGTTNASGRQVRYYVTALDDEGETIVMSNIHGTIFLKEAEPDICFRELFLSWENYLRIHSTTEEELDAPFDKIEILTSVNEGPETVKGEMDFGPREVTLQDVEPGNYSIIIRAHGSGVSSSSNVLEIDVSALTLPVFPPYISSVDIVEDQYVEISWHADPEVVSPSYVVRRSENASEGFEILDTIASDRFEDVADPHARRWFYQVEMLDSCGNGSGESQIASTLFLKASHQDMHTIVLEWEHQPGWDGGVQHYDILRKLPGEDQFSQVDQTGGAVNRYEDDLGAVADEMRSGVVHYHVAGHEGIGNGFEIQVSVVSNIVAIASEETIFVPNAFKPSSNNTDNQVFKPALVAVSDDGYQLLVFNRWGEQIFMSTGPDEGWDGTAGSEPSPAGVYAWVLRYKDGSGQQKEKRGVVTLIR